MAEAESIRDIENLARAKEEPKYNMNRGTKNNVCKPYLHNGVCKNSHHCPFSHDVKRIKICEHFARGVCNKGDDCDFRHDVSVCKYFGYGACKNGSECQYKHIKNVCRFYAKGFCPIGEVCPNYHEKKEACTVTRVENRNKKILMIH